MLDEAVKEKVFDQQKIKIEQDKLQSELSDIEKGIKKKQEEISEYDLDTPALHWKDLWISDSWFRSISGLFSERAHTFSYQDIPFQTVSVSNKSTHGAWGKIKVEANGLLDKTLRASGLLTRDMIESCG